MDCNGDEKNSNPGAVDVCVCVCVHVCICEVPTCGRLGRGGAECLGDEMYPNPGVHVHTNAYTYIYTCIYTCIQRGSTPRSCVCHPVCPSRDAPQNQTIYIHTYIYT